MSEGKCLVLNDCCWYTVCAAGFVEEASLKGALLLQRSVRVIIILPDEEERKRKKNVTEARLPRNETYLAQDTLAIVVQDADALDGVEGRLQANASTAFASKEQMIIK